MKEWLGKSIFVLVVTISAYVVLQQSNLVVSQMGPSGRPAADRQAIGSDGLQVVSSALPNGMQQLCLIDSQARTIAVYLVDPAQGKLELKSVRSIRWDLQMEEFNAQAPLPSELRAIQPN